jgi:hypothetical protein
LRFADLPRTEVGTDIGVLRGVYLADNGQRARKLPQPRMCVLGFREVFHHLVFTEAWRQPDEERYPSRKNPLPASRSYCRTDSAREICPTGNVDDVRRGIDELVEKANLEWFAWQGDHGFLPKDEVKRQLELFGKKLLPRYAWNNQ